MNDSLLHAGAAQSVVPSEPGLDLAGYVARDNPSRGQHDDIMVRALALRGGDCLLVLLAVDVLGFTVEAADAMRAAVARRVRAIPLAERVGEIAVILAATHTHSAPASQPLRGCGEVNAAWLQALSEVLAPTAQRAVEGLQPARLGSGIGEVPGVAGNRRGPLPATGSAPSRRGSSAGSCDAELGVLYIQTAQSTLIACVINFACHPVVLGADNLDISADYPGVVAKRLSEASGATALFLNGACGDINPTQRGSWHDVETIAAALAAEVERIGSHISTKDKVLLGVRSRRIALPFLPLPPRAELEAAAQQFQREVEQAKSATQRRTALAFEQWAIEALQSGAPPIEVEIQVLRVGDAALVAVPSEFFVELGLQIKARLCGELANAGLRTALISTYTNGNIGYIPTRAAYAAGGYEIETAHRFYRQPACVAPEAGEMVVATAIALAREMFNPNEETRQ